MSLDRLRKVLADGEPVLSPFTVLGDPDPETSVALAVAAIDAGARALELGLPFSDPCADGPAIQAACGRARAAGVSTEGALDVLAEIHRRRPEVPCNLLVYANLVHARGAARFCADVAARGASTVLVPDLPLENAADLRHACAAHGLGWVPLVAPVTPAARRRELVGAAEGFVYATSVQGVTGEAAGADVAWIRDLVAEARVPVCVGFGLSRPEHVAGAFSTGARLAVVGSHLARVIERGAADRAALLGQWETAIRPLLGAWAAHKNKE